MIYLLNDASFDGVTNVPLLDTKYLTPSLPLEQSNSIILTSKKALESLERMNVSWKTKHIFTVGKSTKEAVIAAGGNVYYSADGYGEELAREIIRSYPFGKYLYCRAKEVASDLGAMLKRSGIAIEEAVVYKTECTKEPFTVEDHAVIIFTSPKTVHCFFRQLPWKESYQAVCIGKTTRKALPKSVTAHLPESPSLEAAVALARSLED